MSPFVESQEVSHHQGCKRQISQFSYNGDFWKLFSVIKVHHCIYKCKTKLYIKKEQDREKLPLRCGIQHFSAVSQLSCSGINCKGAASLLSVLRPKVINRCVSTYMASVTLTSAKARFTQNNKYRFWRKICCHQQDAFSLGRFAYFSKTVPNYILHTKRIQWSDLSAIHKIKMICRLLHSAFGKLYLQNWLIFVSTVSSRLVLN